MAAARKNELKVRREALGLSQVVFAQRTKIPRTTLCRLERLPRSAVIPNGAWTQTALALATFFQCEPEALFPIAAKLARKGPRPVREKERPLDVETSSVEPAEHPIWDERARQLAELVTVPLTTAEVVELRRVLKWKHELVLEVLTAANGQTLYRGPDLKWRRVTIGRKT